MAKLMMSVFLLGALGMVALAGIYMWAKHGSHYDGSLNDTSIFVETGQNSPNTFSDDVPDNYGKICKNDTVI